MKFPLIAKNAIRLGSKTGPIDIAPGETFDAGSKKEMELYLGIDAAELPRQVPVADLEAELIAQIRAAASIEALQSLVNKKEKRQAIIDALTARVEELQQLAADSAKAELLVKIAAAQTLEELRALVADDETRPDITAAAQARWEQLDTRE